MEVTIALEALLLVGLDEKRGNPVLQVVGLEGGENRLRIEEISAIHLGVAGRVAPLVHASLPAGCRRAGAPGRSRVRQPRSRHRSRPSSTLAPIARAMSKSFGKTPFVVKNLIFTGLSGPKPDFLQQRDRLLLAERKDEVLRIAGRAARRRHGDRLGVSLEEGAGDCLLVDRVVRGQAHLLLGEAAVLAHLQDHDVGGRVDARRESRDRAEARRLADRHVDRNVNALRLHGRDPGRGVAHDVDRDASGWRACRPSTDRTPPGRCGCPAGIRRCGKGPCRSASSGTRRGRHVRYKPSARRSCTGSKARRRPTAWPRRSASTRLRRRGDSRCP